MSREIAARAIAQLPAQPDLSLLLAVEAGDLSHTDEAEGALRTVLLDPLRTVLRGHTGRVNAAVYSPDGKDLVTASRDGTARIWTAASGELLHQLRGHTREVTSAAFTPDSSRLITASEDNTALVWDTGTGGMLATLHGHRVAPGPGVHTRRAIRRDRQRHDGADLGHDDRSTAGGAAGPHRPGHQRDVQQRRRTRADVESRRHGPHLAGRSRCSARGIARSFRIRQYGRVRSDRQSSRHRQPRRYRPHLGREHRQSQLRSSPATRTRSAPPPSVRTANASSPAAATAPLASGTPPPASASRNCGGIRGGAGGSFQPGRPRRRHGQCGSIRPAVGRRGGRHD